MFTDLNKKKKKKIVQSFTKAMYAFYSIVTHKAR